MPDITEKDLLQSIKNNDFLKVYFVYGEDIYLKQKYVKKLCETIVTVLPDMNFPKIEGKTATVQKISDEIYQAPIMSEKRCVLVNDFDVSSIGKNNLELLIETLEDIPDTTVVIFVCNSVAVDTKKSEWAGLIKAVKKLGGVIDCKHKTDSELVRYITTWGKKRKVIIENSVARYLIEQVGRDLQKLETEIDKLCSYKKDYISTSDIDKISAKTSEATYFMLPKAVLAENISQSLNILADLLDMKYEPTVLINALIDSFIDIYRVKTALDAGKEPTDIASDFGYSKNRLFVLKNASRQAKKYSFSTIVSCFNILDEADEKLKSGEKNKRLLLERTIILLIETMRGHNIKVRKI